MSQFKLIRSSVWDGAFPTEDPNGRFLHIVIDAESNANVLSQSVLEDLKETLPRASNTMVFRRSSSQAQKTDTSFQVQTSTSSNPRVILMKSLINAD